MRLRRYTASLRTLIAHRVRTALALSGVAVGVAAVVLSRAIGAGAREQIARTIEQMGTNLLIVKSVAVKRKVERPEISGLATSLNAADFTAVSRLPFVRKAAPAFEANVQVKTGAMAMKTTVRGTMPAFLSIRRFEIAAGRNFDADDDQAARRVVVLGAGVADALRQGGPLVGAELRIGDVPFEIVGILRAKGTTADGADQDNQVLVPLRTALRRVFNATWLTAIYISVTEPARMSDAATEIERTLRVRHQRGPERLDDDFAVQDTTKTRALQQRLTESLGRYATGLAAIALLVGGIGILALMLLSVRERTGEIGLRMAVGALPRDILLQFLVEATLLAMAGWLSGVALGGAATVVVARATAWPVVVPGSAVLVSFGMTMAIGLGFGVVPARKAAGIPPIDALLSR